MVERRRLLATASGRCGGGLVVVLAQEALDLARIAASLDSRSAQSTVRSARMLLTSSLAISASCGSAVGVLDAAGERVVERRLFNGQPELLVAPASVAQALGDLDEALDDLGACDLPSS